MRAEIGPGVVEVAAVVAKWRFGVTKGGVVDVVIALGCGVIPESVFLFVVKFLEKLAVDGEEALDVLHEYFAL